MSSFAHVSIVSLCLIFLSACGGGGGGSSDNNSNAPETPTNQATAEITRENLPIFTGTLIESVMLATDFLSSFGDPLGIPAFDNSYNGTENRSCTVYGNTSIVTTGGGRRTEIDFDHCRNSSDQSITGTLIIEFTTPTPNGSYTQTLSFQELSVVSGVDHSSITGKISANIPSGISTPIRVAVDLDSASIGSYIQFSTKGLLFEHPHDRSPYFFSSTRNYRGQINIEGIGTAVLNANTFNSGDQRVGSTRVIGTSHIFGNVSIGEKSDSLIVRHFDGSKGHYSSTKTELKIVDLIEGNIDFFSPSNQPPTANFAIEPTRIINLDQRVQRSVAQYFVDLDGDLLSYNISIQGPSTSYTTDNWQADLFDVWFSEPGRWRIAAIASDPSGDQAFYSMGEYLILDSRDTDGDGIENHADNDDDGDGVPDLMDAFPLDPTETLDSDGDGIGNTADEDDDNDSVPDHEDAYPLNPNCALPSDGDGTHCYIQLLSQYSAEMDRNGIVYFLPQCSGTLSCSRPSTIYRWDSINGRFLAPISHSHVIDGPYESLYSHELHRLYLFTPNGNLSYFALDDPTPTEVLASAQAPGFAALENMYIDGTYIIREGYNPGTGFLIEVLDSDFSITSTLQSSFEARARYVGTACRDFWASGVTLDTTTGSLVSFSNDQASNICTIWKPHRHMIVTSPSREFSVDMSLGNIHARTDPTPIYSLTNSYDISAVRNAIWTEQGLVLVGRGGDGTTWNTNILKLDDEYNLVDTLQISNSNPQILGFNGVDIIILISEGNSSYEPLGEDARFRFIRYRP